MSEECPSEKQILSYLKNEISEGEVEEFERHFFACEACFEELERAREIRAALTAPGEDRLLASPSQPTASRRPVHRHLLLLAATIAFLSVALWVWRSLLPASEELVRRSGEGALSLTVEVVERRVSSSWNEVPDADSYLLQVYSRDGELLAEIETSETAMVLGDDLPEDRVSFMRVEALDALGQSLASSPLEKIPERRE